jgi:hypothetical protein
MKKLLFIAFVFIGVSASAQNYNDSTVTVQLTQRAAWYIGYHIKSLSGDNMWNNRTAPSTLKNYVGSGLNPDSLFTVTLKVSFIKGMLEILLSGQNEATQADRLSIVNGSPVIPGYTALSTQIVAKANGASSEKLAATEIVNYYNQRVADFGALRNEIISNVIKWANN